MRGLPKISAFICIYSFILEICLSIFLFSFWININIYDKSVWYHVGLIFTVLNFILQSVVVLTSAIPMFELCANTTYDREYIPWFLAHEQSSWYNAYKLMTVLDFFMKSIIELSFMIMFYQFGNSIPENERLTVFIVTQTLFILKLLYYLFIIVKLCCCNNNNEPLGSNDIELCQNNNAQV